MKFLVIYLFLSLPLFAQDLIVLETPNLPVEDSVHVYIPDHYEAGREYALVILLHGWTGDYASWGKITNLQHFANLYDFIIACPDGLYDSWYVNSPVNAELRYHDFFFEDFMPALHTSYEIDSSRIFISGLSMGGYGAMMLFLDHPDFFAAAGSTSGILDISVFPGKWGMPDVFGNYETHRDNYFTFSPIDNLDTLQHFNKPLIIDCGASDFAYNVNKLFYERARELDIPATFIAQPGVHDLEYWFHSINAHFRFFGDISFSAN